jgi:hypothetical protein
MQDDNGRRTAAQRRIVRLAFGGMALLSIVAGIVLWNFAAALGLDDDTARLIATVFILVGIGDYLILHFWDRLFKDRT